LRSWRRTLRTAKTLRALTIVPKATERLYLPEYLFFRWGRSWRTLRALWTLNARDALRVRQIIRISNRLLAPCDRVLRGRVLTVEKLVSLFLNHVDKLVSLYGGYLLLIYNVA